MAQPNRNLFRVTRFILLKGPSILRFFRFGQKFKKRILVIKADAIGDYMLFRNFLEILRNSEKFQGYEIDLLGNTLWQDIALKYDSRFIGNFLFTEPEKLYHAPLRVLRIGLKLFRNKYEIVLQPTYARTFMTDGLAGMAAAKQTIGFTGGAERIAEKYKTRTDKFFTEKLPLPPGLVFEFNRSKYFFEKVLGRQVELAGPSIPTVGTEKKGIIIFPGAGVPKRSWEPFKFLELIKLIRQHTDQPIYLAGGPSETKAGEYIEQNLPSGTVNNLIGKTSLIEMIELIGGVSLVVANETSAIHIAAATQTPAICVLGGGHFERFAPYPTVMVSSPICAFHRVDCYHCNWDCKFIILEGKPYPCIENVNIDVVWELVKPFIT